VDRIVVEGARNTRTAVVLQRSGLHPGQALVALDGGGAAGRVEALPWVRSATVRRRWPDRVVIEVRERVPVAAFAGSGRWLLVDADGRRLARVGRPDPAAVPVEGVGARGDPGTRVDDRAAGAVEVSRRLPPAVRYRAPRLRVDLEGRLTALVRVDEGEAEVVFGRPERLRDKVIALATVLESVDLRDLARIDLRIPGAPVLTRG
jgi:cell division protein FtsQ